MTYKIIDDTLKKPSGKWDKQALTMFLFVFLTALTGIYIVVSDLFLSKEINPYAVVVLGTFGTLATGQSVVNVWNKKVDKNLNIDQTENIQ